MPFKGPLILAKSDTPGAEPTAGTLVDRDDGLGPVSPPAGDMFQNRADGTAFLKRNDGNWREIGRAHVLKGGTGLLKARRLNLVEGAGIAIAIAYDAVNDWISATITNTGGGGGGAVSSVFGRTGAVVAASGDYTANLIAGTWTGALIGETQVQSAIQTLDTLKVNKTQTVTPLNGLTINAGTSGVQIGSISILGLVDPLAAIGALTPAADRLPYYTSASAAALATFTSFGRSLVDDADAAAGRTTLGIGGTITPGGGLQLNFATSPLNISAITNLSIGGAITASGFTVSNNTLLGRQSGGSGLIEEITCTAAGRALIDDATAADQRTTLGAAASGAVTGSGLTMTTDRLLGRSTAGTGAIEEIVCTAAGRALLDDADATAQRATLGLVIGTNVQAYDIELAAVAGAGSNTDRLFYYTGVGTGTLTALTAAGRALIDDADAAAQRTTLGLGTLATQASATAAQVDYRESMRFAWDGGGSAPTVNSGAQAMAEHGLVVKAASIVATDGNGDRVSDTLTVQFAKVSSGGTVTTLGSVSLTAAGYVRDTTLSGWTTSIAEGDTVRARITSAGTTATRVSASIKCERV